MKHCILIRFSRRMVCRRRKMAVFNSFFWMILSETQHEDRRYRTTSVTVAVLTAAFLDAVSIHAIDVVLKVCIRSGDLLLKPFLLRWDAAVCIQKHSAGNREGPIDGGDVGAVSSCQQRR